MFAESLSLFSRDKAGLGRLFPQFLVTLFLAWSLFGVLIEQVVILICSLIVYLWRGIARAFRWLNYRRSVNQEDSDVEGAVFDEQEEKHPTLEVPTEVKVTEEPSVEQVDHTDD